MLFDYMNMNNGLIPCHLTQKERASITEQESMAKYKPNKPQIKKLTIAQKKANVYKFFFIKK